MLQNAQYSVWFRTPVGEGHGIISLMDGDVSGGDNIPKANRDASRSNQSTTTSNADWQQKPFGAAALHPTEMINHVRKGDSQRATGRGGDQQGIYLPHLTSD